MIPTPLRTAVEALEYLIREFERTGRIDSINMSHACSAVEIARPALDADPHRGWEPSAYTRIMGERAVAYEFEGKQHHD